MTELDFKFGKACKTAEEIENVPIDTQLRLYAYYKQAVKGDSIELNTNQDIVNSFKINAWFQVKGMSIEEAKEAYINLVNEISK